MKESFKSASDTNDKIEKKNPQRASDTTVTIQ